MSREVPKCPREDCGSVEIHSRSSKGYGPEPEGDGRWKCRQCGASFDQPLMAEPKTTGAISNGIAKTLAEPDFNPEIRGGEES